MVIDREEDIYFYFQLVYVHSLLSASKGIFMDHSSWNNYGFKSQELIMSRLEKRQAGMVSADSTCSWNS